MAAGDVKKEFGMKSQKYTLKTTTGVTLGYVLAYDTDGYAHASTSHKAPFVVALETVTAPASGQSTCKVLEEGVVEVPKVTGAIVQGQWVAISSTAGKVKAYVAMDAPAAYGEATVQAELDKAEQKVGRCETAAASADTTVLIRLVPI